MADWHYYKAPASTVQLLGPLDRPQWPNRARLAYPFARSAAVALRVSFNDPTEPVVDLPDLFELAICFYVLLPLGDYLVISDRPVSALASYRLN